MIGNNKSLSAQLRNTTAELHQEVERSLGLPSSLTTLVAYTNCLKRFYTLYLPLEITMCNLHVAGTGHAARLASDLQALGVVPASLHAAPGAALPLLSGFAQALGAKYVMEGSNLGSQFILKYVTEVLGEQVAGADAFFRGNGESTGTLWKEFRTSLDRYGNDHPGCSPQVIEGAQATFQAIGNWMRQ